METKTVIRITNDYQSTGAYDDFIEQVGQLVNEYVDVHCEVRNTDFTNVVETQQLNQVDRESFKNTTTFSARGYSQSDWQEYTLRYNCEDDNIYLLQLIEELKKSFTHMNDYSVEKFERVEIEGTVYDAEAHDFTGIHIRDIEFPETEEILNTYTDYYGKDYDEVIIDVN